jgi:hypothetical protein
MPRGGSKPGERRGGRQKGTPNKRTVQARLFREAKLDGKPLAKEVLEESMFTYLRLAVACARPESGAWSAEKQKLFHFYREKCDERARWLAPYQSPQYRSITVQPPRETGAPRGTPAIDALESFVLALAKVRRVEAPLKSLPATPSEAAKVIDHDQ